MQFIFTEKIHRKQFLRDNYTKMGKEKKISKLFDLN